MWAFQIGLIKGLLARIRQFKRAANDRERNRFVAEDLNQINHTIVNRGEDYKNVSCAVCLHLKKLVAN